MKTLHINLVIAFLAVLAATEAHKSVVKFAIEQEFCKVVFKDCGSTVGKITDVSFNGTCSSKGWAILKKGTTIQIDFQFQANNVETVLKSSVHGKLGILPWAPFPMDNPDACKDSGLACPIPAKTALDYKPLLNVLKIYPSADVLVKWELQNKDGADVYCAVLPATITD